MSAQDRGWGPPCPDSEIVTITAGGRSFRVHRRVAVIFRTFIGELVARGYPIDRGTLDDWSYVCRHIGNDPARPWSNHAWGLAVDINSLTNPMRAPLTTDMPAWVRNAADLMGRYGLRWGGTYQITPDPMHFEFMGTPADADRITAGLGGKEWWTMSIPASEVQKIVDAQAKALATGSGQEALRDALRHVLKIGSQMGNPFGTVNNDQVFITLVAAAQQAANAHAAMAALLAKGLSVDPAALESVIRSTVDEAVQRAMAEHPVDFDPTDVRAVAEAAATIAGQRLIQQSPTT